MICDDDTKLTWLRCCMLLIEHRWLRIKERAHGRDREGKEGGPPLNPSWIEGTWGSFPLKPGPGCLELF
jgi:hypothetical protein